MKSKKIVPFVIYLLGVLPIVYRLINVQCRDKNYIERLKLPLNDRIFLSRTGILVSNAVMADFLL